MNKTQLIDALSTRYEGNRKQAQHALESVLDTITREVARGEKVAITGFGSFEKRVREARWVRNPRTGERVKAKKTAVPKFTAGADLKAVVSGAKKLPKLPKPAERAISSARGSSAGQKAADVAKKATAPAKKAAAVATQPAKKAAAAAKKATTSSSSTTAKKAPAKKASTTAKKTSTTAKKSASSTAKKTTSTAKKATSSASSTAKKAPAKKSSYLDGEEVEQQLDGQEGAGEEGRLLELDGEEVEQQLDREEGAGEEGRLLELDGEEVEQQLDGQEGAGQEVDRQEVDGEEDRVELLIHDRRRTPASVTAPSSSEGGAVVVAGR